MKTVYVVYLSLCEDGNVIFSDPFTSFNSAKQNIDIFLKEQAENLGKKIINMTKEEFAKLKLEKTPDDCIYIRKKNSTTTLYHRVTSPGRFYNSYIIERYARTGIAEFDLSTKEEKKEVVKNTGVENLSHGVHVTFISELKDALIKRRHSYNFENLEKKEKGQNPFVTSLVERKITLRHITPPLPRKINIDSSSEF